jgi:hypothetical protein
MEVTRLRFTKVKVVHGEIIRFPVIREPNVITKGTRYTRLGKRNCLLASYVAGSPQANGLGRLCGCMSLLMWLDLRLCQNTVSDRTPHKRGFGVEAKSVTRKVG